jgi:hypothetical protein
MPALCQRNPSDGLGLVTLGALAEPVLKHPGTGLVPLRLADERAGSRSGFSEKKSAV